MSLKEKEQQDGCTCEDWKVGSKSLNSIISLSSIRGSLTYTGKKFVYCPWCKAKLIWKK